MFSPKDGAMTVYRGKLFNDDINNNNWTSTATLLLFYIMYVYMYFVFIWNNPRRQWHLGEIYINVFIYLFVNYIKMDTRLTNTRKLKYTRHD